MTRLSLTGAAALLILAGCASPLPVALQEAPPNSPHVAQVRQDPGQYVGSQVRWGGEIEAIENRSSETWLEIVHRPLGSSGRPADTDQSAGRFLARVQGFLDPAVYTQGRDVTLGGVLAQPVTRSIGQFPYVFPVVDVNAMYLWPPRVEPVYVYPNDPWWDPWYPWPYYRYPNYPWYPHLGYPYWWR
jgi:outer membrane lipoprotein